MKEGLFIGQLSKKIGIPTQTVRYYEQLGLIDPPKRTDTQYRIYSEEDEARLRFILHAKLFGLSLEEIKEIIQLSDLGIEPCENLKGMVKKHLDELNQRIQEMIAFRDDLARRYEKLDMLDSCPEAHAGKICRFIEREI
ncbi:MerR family transcriptional regulator [Microaerobacter geothermalis]|uniref:MerR family transcriptional regulator n=1 Tax=Microaerobacter geothermalis TaxID=674972 RepID=UPI001F26AB6C|nr:MerR family transcriptional regulator [Microaerobacter geothermalis]MCF6092799.1 MerR family transcriptional regulator [Microaerobacter geothermalis]